MKFAAFILLLMFIQFVPTVPATHVSGGVTYAEVAVDKATSSTGVTSLSTNGVATTSGWAMLIGTITGDSSGGGSFSGCTDTAGDTITLSTFQSVAGSGDMQMGYSIGSGSGIIGNASNVVTCTMASSDTSVRTGIVVTYFSRSSGTWSLVGSSPYFYFSGGACAATTCSLSPNYYTTTGASVVVSAGAYNKNQTVTFSVGPIDGTNGIFTESDNGSSSNVGMQYRILPSSAASADATMTVNNTNGLLSGAVVLQ